MLNRLIDPIIKIRVLDEKDKLLFLGTEDWGWDFKWMRCPRHYPRTVILISESQNELNVELYVCCQDFFDEILKKKRLQHQHREYIKSLDKRAANREISETITIMIGGQKVPEVEIMSLTDNSDNKRTLRLTGNRQVEAVIDEADRNIEAFSSESAKVFNI